MPIGTAFHERTFPLCHSLNYREWSGYYTVSVYEVHHEHEYNAIRNAAALIDISPLYKYLITGKDATRLVNRVITRDINKVKVGQVIYCCWCDEEGKVIDDGTISRLEENVYRWTAADPSLRWFRQNGLNMDVQVEDISEKSRPLPCKGPTSAKLLKAVAEADIANLKYFRVTRGKIAGVPVDISRTGYTGDLGYEIWIPWNDARESLGCAGGERQAVRSARRRNAGARRGPGRSRIAAHRSGLHQLQEGADSVAEVFALRTGLRQDGSPRERKLHRQSAHWQDAKNGVPRQFVGLEVDWTDVEHSTRLRPHAGRAQPGLARRGSRVSRGQASRQSDHHHLVSNPEKDDCAGQRGHSPVANRLQLQMEITIEAMRQKVTRRW